MPPTPATKKKHIKTNATAIHHEERSVLKPILPVTTPPHLKIKKKKINVMTEGLKNLIVIVNF